MGQLRLFEALLELLDCLSDTQPVALVLEDLHWADRSTRTFVTFLARSLRQERLMVLLTFRTDELHRRHPLRPLLAELERVERVRRINLAPFDRPELTEALADILGDEPSAELVERLFSRSEGNPLYTEELLAAGLDGRGSTPQSLRDAFMLRIERLPVDTQAATRAIAVARRADEATIATVTDIEHLASMRPFGRRSPSRCSSPAPTARCCSATRSYVRPCTTICCPASGWNCTSRSRGRSSSATLPTAPAALRPRGRSRVTMPPPAINRPRCARSLGRHERLAMPSPTARPRTSPSERSSRGRAFRMPRGSPAWIGPIVDVAAAAAVQVGDYNRSTVLLESALAEITPETDPYRYSWVLARLARTLWALNRGLEGVATAERALAMLPDSAEPSHERAMLLGWLARTRVLRGRFRDAIRAGEKALEEAMAAGDFVAEGEVLNTLGMAQIALGEVDEGVVSLRQAIAIAERNEDADGITYAYANLADLLSLRGRGQEALEVAREGLSKTPRRLKWAHEWMSLTLSEIAFELGDWETARTHLVPSGGQILGTQLIFCLLRDADLALGLGDEELAERRLTDAEPLVEASSEPQWIGVLGSMMGELRRRRRDLPGARAAVAAALDRLELCTTT